MLCKTTNAITYPGRQLAAERQAQCWGQQLVQVDMHASLQITCSLTLPKVTSPAWRPSIQTIGAKELGCARHRD